MLRLLVGLVALMGISIGYPHVAAAQPQTVTITLTSGGAPVPNAQLFLLFDAQPEPVATTSASGVAQFPLNRLRADFANGSNAFWQTRWCSKDAPMFVYFKGEKRINPMWTACPANCLCKEQRSFTVHDTMAFELPRASFGGAFMQNRPSQPFVKSIDFQGGLKRSTFPSVDDSVNAMSGQLRSLNYNTVNSETTQKVGVRAAAGIKFGWGDKIGPRLGFAYENLGEVTSTVHGSRINVPNTASNVDFTSDTEITMSFAHLEIGFEAQTGKLHVTANAAPGWARVKSTTNQRLLGGAAGPTPPTTQVNSDTETTSTNKFGVGWNVSLGYTFAKGFGASVGYQDRRIKDAFPATNNGQFATRFDTKGYYFVASYTFSRLYGTWPGGN